MVSLPAHRSDLAVLAALLVLCVGGGALIGVAFAGQSATYQQFDLPPWARRRGCSDRCGRCSTP